MLLVMLVEKLNKEIDGNEMGWNIAAAFVALNIIAVDEAICN